MTQAPVDTREALPGLVELDPRVALRPNALDPFALWVVYLMRKAALPLALLGGIVLSLTGRDGDSLDGVDTVGELLTAIRSPLVLLVTALVLRIGATVLGFAMAYPLSHRATMVVESQQGRRATYGRWMDRLHVTRAYRSLRWTKAVRNVAAERIGPAAGWLELVERVLSWSLPMLFVGSLIAHALATT